MKLKFNIELNDGYNQCCLVAVKTAALINGGQYPLFGMEQIKKMAEAEKQSFPELNEDTSIEMVDDSLLHIDTKVNGEWKTVCRIEMVEVGELATIDDLQDVL